MNSISWMIYAADVAGSLSNVATTASIISGIGGVVCGVSYIITLGSPTIWSWDDKASKLASHKALNATFLKAAKVALAVVVPCALFASVIPSRDTIYAMAASESVEAAAKTATAQKALTALNAWLDRQSAPAVK